MDRTRTPPPLHAEPGGMITSDVRKGFGGGLFTKIPEILAKKIAK